MNLRVRLIVRAPTEPERAPWASLFDAYAAFYAVTLPPGCHDRVWGWIQDPDNDFWCDLAITSENEAIGLVHYQLMHRSLSAEMVCYLSDLYVSPATRSGGIGRALIDHVMRFARERGISNVRWLTQEGNERARTLYDSYAPRSEFVLYSVPVSS